MLPCARYVNAILARDASFVALAGITLMVGFSFDPALACTVGATVAILFAVLLICRSYTMTEQRFRRSEAWRALTPEERPAGDHGRHLARATMQELMLRFAKNAAALAIVLYATALVTDVTAPRAHDTFVANDTSVAHDTFVTAALPGTTLE